MGAARRRRAPSAAQPRRRTCERGRTELILAGGNIPGDSVQPSAGSWLWATGRRAGRAARLRPGSPADASLTAGLEFNVFSVGSFPELILLAA